MWFMCGGFDSFNCIFAFVSKTQTLVVVSVSILTPQTWPPSISVLKHQKIVAPGTLAKSQGEKEGRGRTAGLLLLLLLTV